MSTPKIHFENNLLKSNIPPEPVVQQVAPTQPMFSSEQHPPGFLGLSIGPNIHQIQPISQPEYPKYVIHEIPQSNPQYITPMFQGYPQYPYQYQPQTRIPSQLYGYQTIPPSQFRI